MYKVTFGELSLCDITYSGRIPPTQLCIITSLKWIIQICSNFYCWICKIAFDLLTQSTLMFGETSPLMKCAILYIIFSFTQMDPIPHVHIMESVPR